MVSRDRGLWRAQSLVRPVVLWAERPQFVGGSVRAAGRITTEPAALELFARSLIDSDQVVIEATANAVAIARIIEPHVRRVVLANPKAVRETSRRAKTDRIDAKVLARLLDVGFLDEVWTPDDATQARRRLITRRCALVRARTRAKNQVHAVLARNLLERPPMSDLFGGKGRAWLAERSAELPLDERLAVDAGIRQIDFLSVKSTSSTSSWGRTRSVIQMRCG